ncbi:MAG: hypothetical protein HONBIEJF_01415 [Fimbriimonadaceae bacterium]|nr:hypothetical protein [Fimbriimonadaceae bacterium]
MARQFPTLTPYLVVDDAKAAITFYEKALGAEVVSIAHVPDSDRVMNAQLRFGDSMLMLNDEFPDWGSVGPKKIGGSAVTIHVNSMDIDNDFQRAIDAGAEVTMPLADMFWGDRYGSFVDPFGHKWSMGQQMRDMTPEEMEREMRDAFAQMDKH